MEYDNSICKYCKYRNSWVCSEGYYPTKGCENWNLDDYTWYRTDIRYRLVNRRIILTL